LSAVARAGFRGNPNIRGSPETVKEPGTQNPLTLWIIHADENASQGFISRRFFRPDGDANIARPELTDPSERKQVRRSLRHAKLA
jgi:hypothetical protein